MQEGFDMHIKQCRFLLNTLNQAVKKQNLPLAPKLRSGLVLDGFGGLNPYTAEITVNKFYNCRLFRPMLRKVIKHETKHMEQFQIMARYIAGMAGNIDAGINNFRKLIVKKFPHFDGVFTFNKNFYKDMIARSGVIKEGHPQFEKAKEYVRAFKEYPDISLLDDMEIYTEKGYMEMLKHKRAKLKLYKNNLLEVEARKAAKEK